LSLQVLHWLVRHLLSAGNLAHAEVLLAQYCVTRRNPLSSVAAVKEAIMQVKGRAQHNCEHNKAAQAAVCKFSVPAKGMLCLMIAACLCDSLLASMPQLD
jgi:hypothetical protein